MARECNCRSLGKLASLSREASDKSVHSRRDGGLLPETAAQAIKATLTAGTLGLASVTFRLLKLIKFELWSSPLVHYGPASGLLRVNR
jgi:hypothetical protein